MAFALDIIKSDEGEATRYILEDGSYLIGRGANCALQLPDPGVSERHALLLLRGQTARLEDLHSANGTYINGSPIDGLVDLPPDGVVQIGSTMMRVSPAKDEIAPPAEEEYGPSQQETEEPPVSRPETPPAPPPDPLAGVRRQVKEQIQRELIARLDLKRLTVAGVDRAGLERQATDKIHEIVEQVRKSGKLPKGIDADRLESEVFNEALRLGPLEELLADDSVTEIMVNGPHRVYVERGGKIQLTDLQFLDDASVMAIIERIVSPIGRRIDESQPHPKIREENSHGRRLHPLRHLVAQRRGVHEGMRDHAQEHHRGRRYRFR